MLPPCLVIKTEGLLDSAEGCKYTPQAADKQAFVLWAAYCLYLQPSAVEKARTLHLCPVGATADCESVHRSCPSCGSRIHSQQVSVLGQLLNGILWRRIPSRTPVSSGLRTSAKDETSHLLILILQTWFLRSEETHKDVASWVAMMPWGRKGADMLSCCGAKNKLSRRSRPWPPCPKTYLCFRARRSRSWSLGIANRTRHVGLLLLRRTDAMMGCHRRYASVLKALLTTDAEDITCGQKRHTRNSGLRDTQEIQAWLNYLNGCNELMQQVGLKRRVTEFTSVVDNAWR